MAGAAEELRAIVRRFHVYFDVQPELEVRDRARTKIGFTVRLWGVHAKGARPLPGCAACREMAAQLRRVAEFVVARDGAGNGVFIEPAPRALYDSRVVPGADEIALPIRVHSGRPHASSDGLDERFLKEIRGRLRELGAPER